MTSVHSLEQERQAILDRMQMRRESYRRMLSDGEDFRALPPRAETLAPVSRSPRPAGAHVELDVSDGAVADTTRYSYRKLPDEFPRTRLMRTVGEHPILVALGLAAVFAIGPRRIVRSMATGGAVVGAVAASQSRMDMIGRVLNLVGNYAQRRRAQSGLR